MNENNDILYLHITPCGKKYFGVASTTANQRWKNGKGYKENEYFTNAIEKYGWDNIDHIILAKGLTSFEADLFEIFCIAYYDTMNRDIGYNLTSGGRDHFHHSEESKQKMSEKQKGLQVGEKNPFYGKHHTEETKQKISESHKGENNPMYGKYHSEETRKKMSEAQKGKKSFMYGKTGKDHHSSKTVICITTGQVYYGASEAGRAIGITHQSISKVCNGKGKSAGKLSDGTPLKWKYVQDLPKPQVSEDKKQLLRNGPKPLKIVC